MTYDVELENKLKKWRESLDDVMELYRNNDTPQDLRRFKNGWGCISDKNIQTLVVNKPRTKYELLKLEDFGRIKIEKYGEDILEIINSHEQNNHKNNIDEIIEKADKLFDEESFEEAIIYYKEALEIDPRNSDLWNNLGASYYNTDKIDDAIDCYNKAISLNPEDENVWFNKGVALETSGRYDEALECYSKVLDIDPKHVDAIKYKADVLCELNRLDDAIHCNKKALEYEPDNDELIDKIKGLQEEKESEALRESDDDFSNTPFICENNGLRKYGNNIFYFLFYPPSERIHNDRQRYYHNYILNIKNSPSYAKSAQLRILKRILRTDFDYVICVIPSHEKGLKETSIRVLAKELCNDGHGIDGTSCLLRIKTIPEKHKTNTRDINIEIASLQVQNRSLLKNKIVLIMDDIITSGTSMYAAIKLTYEAGAKEVYGLTIAKTTEY